jgi:hypothetical protein
MSTPLHGNSVILFENMHLKINNIRNYPSICGI